MFTICLLALQLVKRKAVRIVFDGLPELRSLSRYRESLRVSEFDEIIANTGNKDEIYDKKPESDQLRKLFEITGHSLLINYFTLDKISV